jgi:hypothetical protein
MFTSQINTNISMPLPETVFEQINNATHATATPVAMMHYQYNKSNPDALDLNLMRIINGDQLQDVPGAASPYLLQTLFVVAPTQRRFRERTVSFVFPQSLYFTNSTLSIQQIAVNFNNETGYVPTSWNNPISHNFTTGGVKEISFRVTFTNGISLTSRTHIFVRG